MIEKTLAIIKPDGVKRKLIGECIKRIEKAGAEILGIKMQRLTLNKAKELYGAIENKHPRIYKALLNYMTEGPICTITLRGENIPEKIRKLAGPTDPKQAPGGTIRGDFARGDMKKLYKQGKVARNIIHTSENAKEARREMRILTEERQGRATNHLGEKGGRN